MSETGSGFGNSIWSRCAAPSHTFASFDQPFSYTPPAGLALSNFENGRQEVAIVPPAEREAEMDVWSVGPRLDPDLLSAGDDHHVHADRRDVPRLPALSAGADRWCGDADDHRRRPATIVDVTTAAGAKGCPGDQRVHLWNEAPNQTSLALGDTERIIAMDQGGSTLVFEVHGKDLPAWWTDVQTILDTVTFQAAAGASPAP